MVLSAPVSARNLTPTPSTSPDTVGPILFFSVAAGAVAALGLAAAVPVFEDWIRDRYIYHVPLAILATGLEIVAIVLVAIGLILDSITQQDKRRFERQLLQQPAHL